MDMGLVNKGLEISSRRKRWILLFAACGFTGYGFYRVYNIPSLVKKRMRLLSLVNKLISIIEIMCESAQAIGVVSKDLKEFLQSDSDQIPQSLKQISKITTSEEFSESLAKITEALTSGVLQGYRSETKDKSGSHENLNFTDSFMDKIFSERGSGFASVIVGSFARNLVIEYNSGVQSVRPNCSKFPLWVDLVCSDKSRQLIADCVQTFVSTAVSVYLDKIADVNTYDDFFSGMTNPKHRNEVRDILVSICKGFIETLVKTSHQVLTTPNFSSKSNSNFSCSVRDKGGIDFFDASPNKLKNLGFQNGRKLDNISSALSSPSNRRFLLDVTGRVTFETVKSVLEFFMWKLSGGLKRCVNAVHDEVLSRGLEVVRYFGAKSSVILTICFALFLHILDVTRVILPA